MISSKVMELLEESQNNTFDSVVMASMYVFSTDDLSCSALSLSSMWVLQMNDWTENSINVIARFKSPTSIATRVLQLFAESPSLLVASCWWQHWNYWQHLLSHKTWAVFSVAVSSTVVVFLSPSLNQEQPEASKFCHLSAQVEVAFLSPERRMIFIYLLLQQQQNTWQITKRINTKLQNAKNCKL